jgi:predicted hotdog family 3-hydroxylacyl-ACP dehydratase
VNATILIPSEAGYFEGHFPGRPILPGVAELELALQALAQASGRTLPLRGIAFARLRQLVMPGDRLELSARELDGARVRIELRRAEELVANGELLLGHPLPESVREGSCGELDPPAATLAWPLDALLPHCPPMLFVTSVVRESADGLICTACIPAACALVADGFAPALAAVEAAAQTAAAWEAIRRSRVAGGAQPRVGYLVGMRDVAFLAERIPADEMALASVQLEAAVAPLTHYRFEFSLGGWRIARGRIATYLTQANGGGAAAYNAHQI